MNIELISIFGALGVGGILGAYFQSVFQRRKDIEEDIHQLKSKRYGSILIPMITILDPERGLAKIQEHRPDLKTLEDVKEEVKTEMMNSIMFANDDVIKSMSAFVQDPTAATYTKTASAMRKDLWGKKTRIGEEILKVLSKG